jgi:CubicO group peptidase (beta-lactamase class C family)
MGTKGRYSLKGVSFSCIVTGASLLLTVTPSAAKGPDQVTAVRAPSTSLSSAQVVSQAQTYLDRMAAEGKFSGTVLIAKDDKIIFQRAYGQANHAFKVPNNLDTKFNLGSMGKMFTAVSILQLVEQGKISLDDSLIKILPDYPDPDIANKVTVYQLLTHTSGFGNMFNQRYDATPKDRLDSNKAHAALFSGIPLLFEPGARWEYSNSGYIVLGLIIEKVSGQSYFDYVREHVFKPAGMSNTDNFKLHDDVSNLAVGYTNMPGGPDQPPRRVLVINSDWLAPGSSAGGGYSTVGDLLRFSQALKNHVLLSKALVDLATTGKFPTGRGTAKYGFGMATDIANGVRFFGHSGGAPGISSNLDIYPDIGYIAVVMSNSDTGGINAAQRLRMLLTGQKIPQAIRLQPGKVEALTGIYAFASPTGGTAELRPPFEIVAEPQGLAMVSLSDRRRFRPLSADEFFDPDNTNARIIFERNGTGQVVGATLRGVGGPGPLKATKRP